MGPERMRNPDRYRPWRRLGSAQRNSSQLRKMGSAASVRPSVALGAALGLEPPSEAMAVSLQSCGSFAAVVNYARSS